MPNGSGRGRGLLSTLGDLGKGVLEGRGLGGSSICRCPKCGYTQDHGRGTPCSRLHCPKCGSPMRGERCS